MVTVTLRDDDRVPPDIDRAVRDAASEALDDGASVRVLVGDRILICTTLAEVGEAQRGRIPRGALRLDGTRT